MDLAIELYDQMTWWGVLGALMGPGLLGILLQVSLFNGARQALIAAGLHKGEGLLNVYYDGRLTIFLLGCLAFLWYIVYSAF